MSRTHCQLRFEAINCNWVHNIILIFNTKLSFYDILLSFYWYFHVVIRVLIVLNPIKFFLKKY